jgi:hypothetical protein
MLFFHVSPYIFLGRCTVRLIRKRKCVEEITIGSHSDDQEDKVTPIKEKKKQTPRITQIKSTIVYPVTTAMYPITALL